MFTKENTFYWKKFSDSINVDFKDREYWHSAKSVKFYKGFEITFDNYAHYKSIDIFNITDVVTRICVTFVSDKDLRFKLTKTTIFDSIINVFSKNKIETDDKEFNRQYLILSKNKKQTLFLLNKDVRKCIRKIKGIHLEIGKNKGIWEDDLERNKYELSIFINKSKPNYTILNDSKYLMECIIDTLTENFIKPVNENL